MTTYEALAAARYALFEIAECAGDVDRLDEASELTTCHANCPADFTPDQRDLAQRILVDAYMQAIGRA